MVRDNAREPSIPVAGCVRQRSPPSSRLRAAMGSRRLLHAPNDRGTPVSNNPVIPLFCRKRTAWASRVGIRHRHCRTVILRESSSRNIAVMTKRAADFWRSGWRFTEPVPHALETIGTRSNRGLDHRRRRAEIWVTGCGCRRAVASVVPCPRRHDRRRRRHRYPHAGGETRRRLVSSALVANLPDAAATRSTVAIAPRR